MIIQLTGTMPLMMHNNRLADPEDFYTRAVSKITDKRKNMTEEDRVEKSRLQFTGGLYVDESDEQLGPYLPGPNLIKCLRQAGHLVKHNKGGGEIERGLILLTDRAYLEYSGPRDADGLWGNGKSEFVDRRIVKINGSSVTTTRPIFVTWGAEFEFELDLAEVSLDDFQTYAEKAGKVGIGDARKIGYGRFTVKTA